MNSEQGKIKDAFERSAKALSLRPSLGKGTGVSKVKITGLTCQVEEGPWRFTSDMPEQAGGNATGPTPGVYGRAALGSCLAMGYMMYASHKNIAIRSLEVEVQADYDDGALFNVSNAAPGYLDVRYIVTIDSEAPEETILQLLDEADKHSSYLDVFSRAQQCSRQVNIISSATHQ